MPRNGNTSIVRWDSPTNSGTYQAFKKWALEFMGPITSMSWKKKYILVCTDFVTQFGIPREIVTDRGTQFISKLVYSITKQYKIKHRKSILYHPQANRKVESTNKVIESISTKTVQPHHGNWADMLLEALWAYMTTWRNTTGHTTYELVYGKQFILPIKFQIKTFWTKF